MQAIRDKIVLTPRGMVFRKELEQELAQEEVTQRLPKLTIQTSTPKSSLSNFMITKTHRRLNTDVQTARELRREENTLYPNYLRRDPKEYPPTHQCKIKVPNFSFRRKEKIITSQVKSLHHTLYNSDKRWALQQDPSVKNLNSTIFGPDKTLAFPINISNTKFDFESKVTDVDEINQGEMDASKIAASIHKETSPGITRRTITESISWAKTRSSNFLQTARLYDPSMTSKTEKLLQIFQKSQRDFENTLIRVEEKAIAKMSNFETDRGDLFKFKDKLREAEQTLTKLREKKKSEDLRYIQRIENLKISKYSCYKHHYKPKPKVEIVEGDPLIVDTIKANMKSEKGDSSPHNSPYNSPKHQSSHFSPNFHHMNSDTPKIFHEFSSMKSAINEVSEPQSRKFTHPKVHV